MRFMDNDALIEILNLCETNPSEEIESEIVEFKEYSSISALHNCKKLPLEVSAMANTDGGVIIVGIKDNSIRDVNYNSQLKGITDFDPIEISERLGGKVSPKLKVFSEVVEYKDLQFGVIHVDKQRSSLVSTTGGKYYIKDGRSSRPMTPAEIEVSVKHLQNFDWSSDDINMDIHDALDSDCWNEAYEDYCARKQLEVLPTKLAFLESIGATRNGILNRAGLLFLGKENCIKQWLGEYEYRFSWKRKNGDLVVNQVWSSCVWNSIKKIKKNFDKCNQYQTYELDGKEHDVPLLDEKAFHEALMNAIVHRDYALDGMIIIEFTDKDLIIRNPGTFYGGVSPENILVHEPKHRNKTLASLMMQFSLVDRAGVGIKRISYRSLMYGRGFPKFEETSDSISVIMKAEALIPIVFVISQDPRNDLSIVSLLILNLIANNGFVRLQELETKVSGIVTNGFQEIVSSLDELLMLELVGNNDGVYIRIKKDWKKLFSRIKTVKVTSTSDKHVKVYKYIKKHGMASNEEITELLEHKYPSHTSQFLRKSKYLKKQQGKQGKWVLR